MTIYNEIGQSIVYWRKRRGLTQEKLALDCEMSVSYLRLIEYGRANPTIKELTLIAYVLKVDFRNPFVDPDVPGAVM